MLEMVARFFFVLAAFITGFFVSKDSLKFDIIQMVVAVLLFTLLMFIAAFWPMLKAWFIRKTKK